MWGSNINFPTVPLVIPKYVNIGSRIIYFTLPYLGYRIGTRKGREFPVHLPIGEPLCTFGLRFILAVLSSQLIQKLGREGEGKGKYLSRTIFPTYSKTQKEGKGRGRENI